LKAGSFGFYAKTLDRFHDLFVEIASAIEDQVARCRIGAEGSTQLLDYPRARRRFCCIKVYDSPSVVSDDEKAIEHAEGDCWHSEEIHRSNCFPMVAQKRSPWS
jgi:hypothetical protein